MIADEPANELPQPQLTDVRPGGDGRTADGDALDRAHAAQRTAERGRDLAEASRDRFSFLAEASRCLADSLDYETTLTTVAGMSLPYLGAWCIVDLVEEHGQIRRLAVLHPDPAKQATARELHRRFPPHADDLIGAPRVIRTARPEMVFDVSHEALAAAAQGAEHLALLRELGVRSYVVVPMTARGRVVGAITFVTADRDRRFGDIDVVIAEDLARRAAMAVDNARLYGEAELAREAAEDAFQEAEMANEALAEARDIAERAVRTRSDFLAMLTHEVRTPLNAIVGYMQLLEMAVAGDLTEAQRSYVSRARDSCQHLLRLVDEMLDLARSEADRLEVAQEVARASDAARVALSLVEPLAAGRLITIVDGCAEAGGLQYVGDEFRVRQVLVNLLTNAVKFTPPGGRVTLECVAEEREPSLGAGVRSWVVFRVRDTGRGVSAEDAAVIFEPFVQGQAGLTRTHSGSGLGLSISRRLARLMGGDVALAPSAADTPGACFVFRVPAADGAANVPHAPPSRAKREEARPSEVDVESRTPPPPSAAAGRGLAAAGEALLREMGTTIDEFVRRARAEPTLRIAAEMSDVAVADHLSTLLTDIANSLAVLAESGGQTTDLLTDGAKIQRLIGELHGAQRHRLGWSEADLRREAVLVGQVCREALGRCIGGDERAAQAATHTLDMLLEERMRACLSGHRGAARQPA